MGEGRSDHRPTAAENTPYLPQRPLSVPLDASRVLI